MGLDVRTVAFGPASVDLLAEQVAEAKGGDALAPTAVVVPTNYVGTAMRRALAERGGVAAVTFLTVHRLAEQLGAARLAAAGRRPVSPPFVAAAVRAVLARDPGIFRPVATHRATEEALARTWRELAGVTDAGLDALAAQSERAADVVRIAREVTAELRRGWHDEHDLLGAATEAVRGGDPLVGSLGPIVVHLPRDLPPAGAALLLALAERTSVTVNVGVTGDERADAGARRVAAALGVELPAVTVARPLPTRIVTVTDADEEVRAAVQVVVDAMRAGVPLGRMAVVYGSSAPYAHLVHEHLEAAGIPHSGSPPRTVGDALLGRTLRGLLALPDARFRRAEVLGLLACNLVRGDDARPVPSRAWERISRKAGVVDGDDWGRRLETFAVEHEARAKEADADDSPTRARRLRDDAARARALAAFVDRLRADLAAGDACRTWHGLSAWAKGLLDRYLGGEARRLTWPDEERQAADRVEQALDRLAGLDAVAGPPPTVDVFRRTLDADLAAALPRVGRLGDGVLVGHVSVAAGLCLDRVVVLGLAEGAFPTRRLDDSLLPDREREAAGGELPLRGGRIDDEHRDLLAVLAGAAEAVLCFPRGDLRRTGERTASRWLLDAAGALAGSTAPVFTRDLAGLASQPWYEERPSFLGAVERSPFPPTEQEHGLAVLLDHGATGDRVRGVPLVAVDPVIAAGVDLVLGRASASFTRFDGNLAGARLVDPTATTWSTTRLEAWATCPHRYLFEYVLGVEVPEKPERVFEIDALTRGSLVHEILERFVREVIVAGDGPRDWNAADRARLVEIGEQVCGEYDDRGLTGRPIFWRRDRTRILADLGRFLDEDARARAWRDAWPVGAEHPFGVKGAPTADVRLADGRVLRFRGTIDRVDRAPDGSLVVIDYKTGKSDDYRSVSPENPDDRGTRLQLRVYAQAARASFGSPGSPVHATYWFPTSRGRFEWAGYDVDEAVEQRVDEVLAAIADGIAAGVFPARPNPKPPWKWTDCHYCDPDGLGTGDRRRDWERKRTAPAVAAYAALAEPDDEEAGSG